MTGKKISHHIITNNPAQKRARHQVSLPYSSNVLPSPSLPTRHVSPTLINLLSRSSSISHARRDISKQSTNQRCLFDALPDEILLEIFDFCADENERWKEEIEAWQTLVHVCCRWRSLVFGSPHRLNLRLFCTSRTRARDTLGVWPALPLIIQCFGDLRIEKVDDIVAVLERSNRVCQINLEVSSSHLEKVWAAMHVPFPELTSLCVTSKEETVAAIPDSFLGGSALRLQDLKLKSIPFPGLPNLLLSAVHLVDLSLYDIPHSRYISPGAMVIALSALTSLRELHLGFQSPLSSLTGQVDVRLLRHAWPSPFSHFFWFKGVGEYLEDLVASIDAPQLSLQITLFNQIIFDTPQLNQFISRTSTLKAPETARVIFEYGVTASIELLSRTFVPGRLKVVIPCKNLDWQVSSLEQVCASCLPSLPTLEVLYITEGTWGWGYQQDSVENTLWLELLRPFTGVKKLYLSETFAGIVGPALQELGGRTTELLPSLQNFFCSGFKHQGLSRKTFSSSLPRDRPVTP